MMFDQQLGAPSLMEYRDWGFVTWVSGLLVVLPPYTVTATDSAQFIATGSTSISSTATGLDNAQYTITGSTSAPHTVTGTDSAQYTVTGSIDPT
jgi:hypothetical protein